MPDWSKYFGTDVGLPASSEQMRSVRTIKINDSVLDTEHVSVQSDAWCVKVGKQGLLARLLRRPKSVRLFEIENPNVDECLLVYRAKMKPEALNGQAYLGMWCQLSGREYFSKGVGFAQVATGTRDWTTYETPFLLKKGEAPNLLKLNIAVKGYGTVFVKDVEVVYAPLRGSV